jgi:hypothetical protein
LGSYPCDFTCREIAPGTPSVGGWVDPRDSQDASEKIKFFASAGIQTIQPININNNYDNCNIFIIARNE